MVGTPMGSPESTDDSFVKRKLSPSDRHVGMLHDTFFPSFFGEGGELDLTEGDMGIANYLDSLDKSEVAGMWTGGETRTGEDGVFGDDDDPRDVTFADSVLGDMGRIPGNRKEPSSGATSQSASKPGYGPAGLAPVELPYVRRPTHRDAGGYLQPANAVAGHKGLYDQEDGHFPSTSFRQMLSDAGTIDMLGDRSQPRIPLEDKHAVAQARRAHRHAICKQKQISRHAPMVKESAAPDSLHRAGSLHLSEVPIQLPESHVGDGPAGNHNRTAVADSQAAGYIIENDRYMDRLEIEPKEREHLSVIRELRSVISGLDWNTRVSMRDSLFRLADSASLRSEKRSGATRNSVEQLTSQQTTVEESAIDRMVANLLYHRYGTGKGMSSVYAVVGSKIGHQQGRIATMLDGGIPPSERSGNDAQRHRQL